VNQHMVLYRCKHHKNVLSVDKEMMKANQQSPSSKKIRNQLP